MKMSLFLFIGIFILLSQGCSKKGNSGVQGNGAGIVLSAAAVCGNDSYQAQSWDNYASFGFKAYTNNSYGSRNRRSDRSSRRYSERTRSIFDNIGYAPGAGFCGCSAGTIPACDSEGGITCIRQSNVVNANLVRMQFDPSTANFVTSGAGPISYTAYQAGGSACYDSVAVTCRLNSSDSCQLTGGTCRPTSRRSQFGVCVY